MNLRFHVSPNAPKPAASREPAPSLLDIDITYAEETEPRGRSHETWSRARGWMSED